MHALFFCVLGNRNLLTGGADPADMGGVLEESCQVRESEPGDHLNISGNLNQESKLELGISVLLNDSSSTISRL